MSEVTPHWADGGPGLRMAGSFDARVETVATVIRNKGARRAKLLALLLVLLALSSLVAMRIGAVTLSPGQILVALLPVSRQQALPESDLWRTIVLQMRLPRVALAGLVGASLAVSGTIFQGLFGNPMADPYVIGVSSGAALGAAAAMLLRLRFTVLGIGVVPVSAFAGAMAALAVVYRLGTTSGRLAMLTLLLAGVAVGSFLSAAVSFVTYLAGDRLHQIVFWLMGGFGHASWTHVLLILPYFAGGFFSALRYSRILNCLVLGEETARYLGVEVDSARRALLVTGALLSGTSVAAGGVVGFVGLIVPHAVRAVAGADHRTVIPASALGGAALVIGADALARWVAAPAELPVGIVTAACGAPFFVYLLKSKGKDLKWR